MPLGSRATVDLLRRVGMLEGVSYLLLLGVAMPLKYGLQWPLGVEVVGWIHGVLFVAFCIALLAAHIDQRWGLGLSALCFAAALLPFGPFVMDRRLRSRQVAIEKPDEAG